MYRGEIENGKWQAPCFVLHFLDHVGAAVPVTVLGSCICMFNTTTYWWWCDGNGGGEKNGGSGGGDDDNNDGGGVNGGDGSSHQ